MVLGAGLTMNLLKTGLVVFIKYKVDLRGAHLGGTRLVPIGEVSRDHSG